MAIAVDSRISASRVELHVPETYHKALMKDQLRGMTRYYALLVFGCLLLFAVVHPYNKSFGDNIIQSMIIAIVIGFTLNPDHWVYVLDDVGLLLWDKNHPIYTKGVLLFGIKNSTVVKVEASNWRVYRALHVNTRCDRWWAIGKLRHQMYNIVFDDSDWSVARELVHRLSSLYPEATIAPELLGAQ